MTDIQKLGYEYAERYFNNVLSRFKNREDKLKNLNKQTNKLSFSERSFEFNKGFYTYCIEQGFDDMEIIVWLRDFCKVEPSVYKKSDC